MIILTTQTFPCDYSTFCFVLEFESFFLSLSFFIAVYWFFPCICSESQHNHPYNIGITYFWLSCHLISFLGISCTLLHSYYTFLSLSVPSFFPFVSSIRNVASYDTGIHFSSYFVVHLTFLGTLAPGFSPLTYCHHTYCSCTSFHVFVLHHDYSYDVGFHISSIFVIH